MLGAHCSSSEALHVNFRDSSRIPLFQMIAKNVGIRQAHGRFVLNTNINTLFSDELKPFLVSKQVSRIFVILGGFGLSLIDKDIKSMALFKLTSRVYILLRKIARSGVNARPVRRVHSSKKDNT